VPPVFTPSLARIGLHAQRAALCSRSSKTKDDVCERRSKLIVCGDRPLFQPVD
jgi:hypothetical protein